MNAANADEIVAGLMIADTFVLVAILAVLITGVLILALRKGE